MDKRLLESAEFYHRRYDNFSTLLIVPLFGFLLFLIFFSLFAKKELTIKEVGEIAPATVIASIQSTSNQPVHENHLKDNQIVRKGEALITYHNQTNQTQLSYLKQEITRLESQQKQIETLKKSIEQESNLFTTPDDFGYEQMVIDYIKRAETLRLSSQKENDDIEQQNQKISEIQNKLSEEIRLSQQKRKDYEDLKFILSSNDYTLDSANSLYSLYQSYQQQLKESEQKELLKNQFLAEIQQNIEQINQTIASYQIQQSSSGAQLNKTVTLDSQLETLKSEQLLNASQEWTAIQTKLSELKTELAMQEQANQKNQIIAKNNGILHVNEEIKGKEVIPEGTILAEIYPLLESQSTVLLVTYVSSKEIGSIKKGEPVKFTAQKNRSDTFSLKGEITDIDYSPTRTKNGNFFKVTAKIPVSKKAESMIRYGMQGKFLIITGEKSYFSYYWDKLLNK